MKNKALFLDRDGVINIDYGYIGTLDRLELIPETINLCIKAQKNKLKIIVITNQAGIAKQKFTLEDFFSLSEHINKIYNDHGVYLDFYFCPYHLEAINPNYVIKTELQNELIPTQKDSQLKENIFLSDYRKPNPGMIIQAANRFNINIENSIFIGDKESDLQAARLAGITKLVMINSIHKDIYKEIDKLF